MDSFSVQGDHFYQGYPVQAPPPGTAPNQFLPPAAVPSQPPAPVSTPLAPPGVSPSPPSTAASYYGTYATPPFGFPPSSAERWSSSPIPAAEPHPYASYPPAAPYDRAGYGHHPYQHQDPFRHAHSFPSPPQACMPLPPRGSDVTRFRKKRPFLPHQNLRLKSKPFKQPQENFRGGVKNAQQVKRAFNSDPRAFNVPINGFPVANNAQILHPCSQGRANETPVNCTGKKRRMDERGEGRPGRNDNRRKGVKRSRPGWNKGKRKKGRKQGGDKSSMDTNNELKETSPTVKGVDAVSVTEEHAQEAAVWSEVHRDVRRRLQEFLHTLDRESFQKTWRQDTQELLTLKGAGGDANAAVQQETQEPTLGGDADEEIEGTQGGRHEVVGEVATSETPYTLMEGGGDADAEMQDTQVAPDGDPNAEIQGTEEAVHTDANAHMAKDDVAAQPGDVDAQQANIIHSSQAGHTDALHSDCTEEQQLEHKHAVQSDSANLLTASAHIDAAQSEEHHASKINMKKLNIIDIPKTDCENAQQFAAEIGQDIEVEDVQECPGVDEAKLEHKQKPLLETVHHSDQKRGQKPEAPTQEELKEREEKTFGFFTKLLEENKDLRNMYIEKCNNGAFECLMCHSKIKKRFSNLVSLVTHASNVLKTKKLPEHRGYGRAVCALLGWDPIRYPKVPKNQVSHSGIENVPREDERAPLGDGDVCAPGGNTVKHACAVDTMEDGRAVDAVKVVPVGNVDGTKLRGDCDVSALICEADVVVHIAGTVEDAEPRGEDDKHSHLGDAGDLATLRDIGSSVEQESMLRDVENMVAKGGIGEEIAK